MRNKRQPDREEAEEIIAAEDHDIELEAAEEQSLDKIKRLRDKLKACEADKMSALEDLQRARADFLNSRRRLEEQLERDRERITLRHIEALLPLADSFDMAFQDPAWQTADPVWKKGIEAIFGQLQAVFRSHSVAVIDPQGAEFDPAEHEALADNGGDHAVSEVLQKGYKMNDRVIRPAKVIVG